MLPVKVADSTLRLNLKRGDMEEGNTAELNRRSLSEFSMVYGLSFNTIIQYQRAKAEVEIR